MVWCACILCVVVGRCDMCCVYGGCVVRDMCVVVRVYHASCVCGVCGVCVVYGVCIV